jgi:type VI protein secretion system component Hcp
MAWSNDGIIDADELISVMKLMPEGETQMDIELTVKMDGNPILGEGVGTSGDNVLSAFGYHFKVMLNTHKERAVAPMALWVGRNLDAASASLTSALKTCGGNSDKSLEVELRVFRAGGSNILGAFPKPLIVFKLADARLSFQSFVTSSSSGLPTEFLAFLYRSIEIKTTPQMASGIAGATRSCVLTC